MTERICGTCIWWKQPLYTDTDDTRHCKRHAPTRIDPHYTIAKDQDMSWDEYNKTFPNQDLNRYWPITRIIDGCGDWELSK